MKTDSTHIRQPATWAFFLVALILHLGLLLIPVLKTPLNERSKALEISLVFQQPVAETVIESSDAPEEELAEPDKTGELTPPREATLHAESQAEIPPPRLKAKPESPVVTNGKQNPLPSRVKILSSLENMDWKLDEDAPVTIGRATSSELYAQMSRPLMEIGFNRFRPYQLPDSTEIVDRWEGANGVHHVVIKTLNGMTLCGRQEAGDVFRPWTQMPMMFSECAGGGER